MPIFKFKVYPDEDIYWKVLNIFGFNKKNIFQHEISEISDLNCDILERMDINYLYYKHHQITDWNKQKCLKVLRQFLKSRELSLKSKVVRKDNAIKRIYYVSDNNIVKLIIHKT